MTYRDMLNLLLPRAKMLGFVDQETGQVDAAEAELAVLNAVMTLADGWDLDSYTIVADNLFVTTTGERRYALPRDFLRFPRPKHRHDYHLYLYDASDEFGLDYVDPVAFMATRDTTNGTPSAFTVSEGDVLLDPPPNANSNNNYIGRAVYIKRITSLEWRDEILVPSTTALLDGALAQLAILHGSPRAVDLFTLARQSGEKLINHQARIRQPFQRQTGERRRTRRV